MINVFSPRRINYLYSGFIRKHQMRKVSRREHPQSRKPKYKSSMVRTLQDRQSEELLRKKIAARMFMAGFEPITIAEMQKLSLAQLRDWINRDEDFRMAVKDLQEEFLGSLEKKYQYLLYKAYEKLDNLLDSALVGDIKWGVDKTLQIHGKYIERTEDMTPPERLSLIHISEPTRRSYISYAVFDHALVQRQHDRAIAAQIAVLDWLTATGHLDDNGRGADRHDVGWDAEGLDHLRLAAFDAGKVRHHVAHLLGQCHRLGKSCARVEPVDCDAVPERLEQEEARDGILAPRKLESNALVAADDVVHTHSAA